MALKTDKAVEVFSAVGKGKISTNEIEVAEARSAIAELAKNPNPQNRYEIAQIMAFSVNDLMNNGTDWLNMVAEVKNVGVNEKAMFKIRQGGIKAFIQAKGATTSRSKISSKFVTLDTEEVSARPYVNYLELASGKVNFDELIVDAAYQMELAKLRKIEQVLADGFAGFSSPVYASGSGLVKATLDAQIDAFSRVGKVAIMGDIAVISKLADLTGFTTATGTKAFTENIMNEQNQNGYIGNYRTANVIKITNPYESGSLTKTVLKTNLLYILPAGVDKTLKVVNEGEVTSMEGTNIDDNSYEVVLRQMFGAGIIYGNNVYMGIYKDTSIS